MVGLGISEASTVLGFLTPRSSGIDWCKTSKRWIWDLLDVRLSIQKTRKRSKKSHKSSRSPLCSRRDIYILIYIYSKFVPLCADPSAELCSGIVAKIVWFSESWGESSHFLVEFFFRAETHTQFCSFWIFFLFKEEVDNKPGATKVFLLSRESMCRIVL